MSSLPGELAAAAPSRLFHGFQVNEIQPTGVQMFCAGVPASESLPARRWPVG